MILKLAFITISSTKNNDWKVKNTDPILRVGREELLKIPKNWLLLVATESIKEVVSFKCLIICNNAFSEGVKVVMAASTVYDLILEV